MEKTKSAAVQEANIQYFCNWYGETTLEEYKTLKIIRGVNQYDKIVLAVWMGKQKDAFHRYSYRSEEDREKALNELKSREDSRQAYREKRKAERKAFIPEFEIGDIFVGSWGYEQTNVNAYQVVGRKGLHFAIVRPIKQAVVEGSEGHDCCNVKPIKDSFHSEELFNVKVGQYGIKINSCITASKWDGESSFYNSWYY